MLCWHIHMLLLPSLLIKQLVSARNSRHCTVQHTDQTLFLALYSNQPWPFFSHVSKGTTVPKLVSLATIETVELQFVIDQSLAPGISLHPSSFHVACGVWKVVAPPSFLSPLRQSQWTTTLCVLITGRIFFFFTIHSELLWLSWKLLSQGTMLLVLCFSYLLSSNYAEVANSLYKKSSGKLWKCHPSCFLYNLTHLP